MSRLRRKMDENEEGVATTVGTIMALLIFLSILSLITQQYVPVWMEDNEAYHMEEVKGQFADIKGGVDSLVINDMTDYPRYSSVNLGTEGIPMFAGSSPGRLNFSPNWNETENKGMSIEFIDTEDDELVSYTSSGNISYHAVNREFEDQSLIYEHGAIILQQSDGEIMRARPQISVEYLGEDGDGQDNYDISMTKFHLTGTSESIGGTSRVGVTTELIGTFSNSYSGVEDLDWDLTTAYPRVWSDYINNETAAEAETNGTVVEISLPGDDYNINELEFRRVRVQVDVER